MQGVYKPSWQFHRVILCLLRLIMKNLGVYFVSFFSFHFSRNFLLLILHKCPWAAELK